MDSRGPCRSSGASPKPSPSTHAPIISSHEDGLDDNEILLEDADVTTEWPLFMDGLPIDFPSNPALAALASLLEDDGEHKRMCEALPEHQTSSQVRGGGKITSVKSRESRKVAKPYLKPPSSKMKDATVGEASLFLKMWKL